MSFPKATLKEQVEVFLSCQDLIKTDFRSKSDPFVVVYLKDRRTNKQFKEIGRTEVIMDVKYFKIYLLNSKHPKITKNTFF